MAINISVDDLKKKVDDVSVDTIILGTSAKLQGLTTIHDLCESVVDKCLEIEQIFVSIKLNGVEGVSVIKNDDQVTASFNKVYRGM